MYTKASIDIFLAKQREGLTATPCSHSLTEKQRCRRRQVGRAAASGDDGIVDRVSNAVRQSALYLHSKGAALGASRFGKKLLWSTGKAAWIAGTSFLVLVVPLIIELDREAQLAELEGHQATLLGAPSQPPGLLR